MALNNRKIRQWKRQSPIVAECYDDGMLDPYHFIHAGVPVDGTSGTFAGFAPPGAELIDTTGADTYQNTNTLASPTWTLMATRTGT